LHCHAMASAMQPQECSKAERRRKDLARDQVGACKIQQILIFLILKCTQRCEPQGVLAVLCEEQEA